MDDGEHLHILDVRATELQQALGESNQVYLAFFKEKPERTYTFRASLS